MNETYELVYVYIDGEEIITTTEHPFYVPQKGWIAACELRAGDILVTQNGRRVIVEKIQHQILESPIKVYNFEVEDFHTYYVGNTTVLVHNMCKPARITNVSKQNSKIFKSFKPVRGKSYRYSGTGNNKMYYDWDFTHNDIEVYNSKGKHLGSMNPTTGEMYKDAVKGRKLW